MFIFVGFCALRKLQFRGYYYTCTYAIWFNCNIEEIFSTVTEQELLSLWVFKFMLFNIYDTLIKCNKEIYIEVWYSAHTCNS